MLYNENSLSLFVTGKLGVYSTTAELKQCLSGNLDILSSPNSMGPCSTNTAVIMKFNQNLVI